MKGVKASIFVVLAALLLLAPVAALAGETLDAVKARGFLTVGVNGGLFGFGMPDEKGVWRGLDVDTGRAIAAAIFGDARKDQICHADHPNPVYRPSIQRSRCPLP